MNIKPILLVIIAAILSACGDTSGQSVDRRTVTSGDVILSWANWEKITKGKAGQHGLAPGESVYMFSYATANRGNEVVRLSNGMVGKPHHVASGICVLPLPYDDPRYKALFNECNNKLKTMRQKSDVRLSFQQFIQRAEAAVRADGRCAWVGYDRGFDLRVRATGAAARFDDERLFFAKLRC